ncbi:MAG TPA: TetR family transcriptional regulator [Actinomycetota bacterium]
MTFGGAMQVPKTDRQQARHARVIEATLELAAEGGYEAVQMRDVAARADVALGTLYRYFSSKNHLMVAALAERTAELQQRIATRPPRGATPADRVIDVLRRATRALEREPAVSSALVTALASLSADDPKALALAGDIYETIGDIITIAMHDGEVPSREQVIRTLSHVWLAVLMAWVRGWMPASQMARELEQAAELLVHP